MPTSTVYNMNKEKVGSIDLPEAVFAAEVNKALIFETVTAQLSNKRQGTVRTKTRADVRGGGRKPYRQKGTGQARHGSKRSPIFVGGGAAFGPKPRDWTIELPKKQRKVALKSALSVKNQDGTLYVVDKWSSNDGKTTSMAKVFKKWDLKSGLIVTDKADKKTVLSLRNIPNVKLTEDKNINVLDLLNFDGLILTESAVKNISSRLL